MNDCWLGIRNHYISTHPLFGLTRHMFERKSFRCIRKFRNIKRYFMLYEGLQLSYTLHIYTRRLVQRKKVQCINQQIINKGLVSMSMFFNQTQIFCDEVTTHFLYEVRCAGHTVFEPYLCRFYSPLQKSEETNLVDTNWIRRQRQQQHTDNNTVDNNTSAY